MWLTAAEHWTGEGETLCHGRSTDLWRWEQSCSSAHIQTPTCDEGLTYQFVWSVRASLMRWGNSHSVTWNNNNRNPFKKVVVVTIMSVMSKPKYIPATSSLLPHTTTCCSGTLCWICPPVARQHLSCADTHLPSGFSALNLLLIANWVGEQFDTGRMRSRQPTLRLGPRRQLGRRDVTDDKQRQMWQNERAPMWDKVVVQLFISWCWSFSKSSVILNFN